MKLGIKKYMSIFVCAAFLLSVISVNNIDTVKAQPTSLLVSLSINGSIFEDIGRDTYKNGLNMDTDFDDWDPWYNPTGTEDDGSFLSPNEGLVGVSVYLDDNPIPIATTTAPNGFWSAGPFSTFFGKHYLTFKKDGYVTKTRNIDVYAAGIDCNPMFLERADAIIGRVTDTSGAPIIGARVIAYPRGTTNWILTNAVHDAFAPGPDGLHIIEGFTDKFGNYVLKGLQKGNYEIRVTREEYSPQFKTIYGINTDLGPKTLDFTLTLNPGILEGYVRDMSANPIANAIVSIPGLNLSATTDASGYYKIEQIPAGMYTVVAKAQGYSTEVYYYDDANNPAGGDPSGNFNPANAFPVPGTYAPYIHAGQTETLSFQMDVASQECENDISGIVSNGAPIEYAEVEIPGLGLEITTDKSGYYIFTEVPCGTYWIVASDPEPDPTGLLDHKSKKALIVCTIGQDIVQDFVLDENPCTIFGRVLQYDSDWVPVANATVEISNSGISTTTDSFGYYVIENLPVKRWSWWDDVEGFAYKTTEYLLKVSKGGYFSTTEYVKPIPQSTVWQEFHIKKHTGILKGKVTEWDTDQGIKDIKVTCAGRETYTDSNGFYEFVEVPIGSYTVHAEDYTGGVVWPPARLYDNKAKINQQVTYSNVTIVDFRLPDHAAGKITGSVSGYIWDDWNGSHGFSNEGEGVKDVDVTISGKNSVYTDSYGYYVSIANMQDMYGQYDTLVIKAGPPGHVVTADASGYFIAHDNVQTTVDMDITDLSLGIPPVPLNIQIFKLTGDLKGTVYDKDKNKPLPGHIVTVPLEGAPAGYVAFYDNNPTAYPPPLGPSAWAWNTTDALGTYIITNVIPKGDHLVWEYAPSSAPNYHDMFERVDIQSLINKNFGATRKIGRIEGFVWDDANANNTFDGTETSLFNAVVKLSGKSTDPTSNDDNYSSIADSTGYYTILNVRITHDWAEFWNRYTGTAEYSGFYKEKWEIPNWPTPRWRFDNNIEVWWAVDRNNETTVSFANSYDFPLDKKDGGPLSGGPDGLISGYVDLYLSLYSSNADIWVQATNYNTCSDIEGYYLVWNHGVYYTGPPADWGTEFPINMPPGPGEVFPPWGIPSGNYALRARALWYEFDVLNGIETYDPEIYPGTVTVHSETSGINFDLSRKSGGLKGEVHEDKNFTDIVGDLYLKNATVTIGNPDNGIGLPWWQKNTVDGGKYEFNDQQNGILPINEVFLGLYYILWYEKNSCWRTWRSIPVTWNVVTPLAPTTLYRWRGFIDGFVLDCNTYKPIVSADVNATKQRTNPNPSATNEVATYNYDAAENPPINNTDIEGYYLVDCSVSTPKVHSDETEYTVNAAKTNYPAKCLNNITVEFNEINEDNDFLLCKELGNTGVVLGIVYVDANTDNDYDPGEEIGGVTVDIPGLDITTISTTDTYTYTDTWCPGGVDYNFIFADVPLLPNGNDARYWLKFTHIDHEMAYGVFTTNTYDNWDYDNKDTEDDITDDDGNHVPLCGLQTVPDAWIEGLVYAPGSPDERLTDRDDDAKVWIPGAYRQCPTDDVGYYIIGELAPYMPVGSTYPAIHTLVATATGYKPKPQRNVGLNSDTPWNHTWQDFSMELLTSMDYGILQGVVYFDGGIAVGDVGDPGDPDYDLDICTGGNYDGPDPANPFEPNGEYDVMGTGEDTVTEGIRNAVVTLNPTTTTDSYGYYILTDITSEMSHLVDVTVDLFQDAHHNVFVDSGWNTENFAMDAETGSISGRVYEDFDQDDVYDDPLEAIENATVRAWISATPSFSVSVYTEADGMYLMPLVPVPIATGSYTVHAEQVSTHPRYEPNEVDDVHVDPGVTTTGVDITLMREHGDASGTVTYDGIHPLYGAKVEFFFHWYSSYEKIYETYTDASGFYSFETEDTVIVNNELDPGEDLPGGRPGKLDELWEGQWTIQVSHPAFTTKTKDIIVASHYTVDFDFDTPGDLLPNTAKITGTVDPSVSGAIITADRGDIQVQAVSGGSGGYEMWVPWGFYGTISCYDTLLGTLTAGPYNVMDHLATTPPFDDLDSDTEYDDLTLNFDYSGVVTLISPSNGATLTSLNVTFTWNAFLLATTYTIQVDDTPDCSSPIYTNSISAPTTADSHTFSSYATYYWRVTADNSGWSAIWSFTISATGVGPTLREPANGTTITDQTPTFKWYAFTSATSYTIEVDDTPDFSSTVINHNAGLNTEYTPTTNLTDKTGYWWRVKANNSGWSEVWYFYVDTTAGSVSGTVTTGGTTPLGDVIIIAYIIEDWGRIEKVGETTSLVNGTFLLSPLPSGVAMDIAFYKQSYKADSLHITLSAGQHLTGQTMNLEAGTTYTLQLKIGWNLISLPLIIDEDTPIPAIFYPIEGKYTRIHLWDASSGYYVNYRVTPDLTHQNEFKYLKMDVGYWVYATEDANFVLSGLQNTSARNVHLYHGWNMMGYAFNTSKTISTAVTANYNKINLMWRWNAVSDDYELFDPWGRFTNQFTTFTPGYGYWVYADEDTTITIQ